MKRVWLLGTAVLATLFLLVPAHAQTGTITIGMTVSQTGSFNVDSTEQFRGLELWRDQVNAAGGIKVGNQRYQVRFVTYDDESKGARVQQLYTRLILNDKAEFLISPYSSPLTATAAIVSEQYGKIMITTGAAEDKTYKLGNKRLFQMFTPASHYLVSALDVLKSKDPHARLAFVYSDDAFSNAVAAAGKVYAKQIGLNIVFDEAYAPDTTDFSPLIDKVISAKATALVGGGHYADGSTLARQLHAQKAGMKFICLLVAPDSPKFSELGDAAYGITVPSQWEPETKFKPQVGPTSVAFTQAYEDKYHAPPSYESAGGYAAGLVLAHAIERAGSLDPNAVTNALNQTDLTLFYGQVKFATDPGNHGLQVAHQMVLAQWQKDKQGNLVKQVVWPESAKTAKLIYPLR
jgi:branched-chain amino acid transport system substrate-binding protein